MRTVETTSSDSESDDAGRARTHSRVLKRNGQQQQQQQANVSDAGAAASAGAGRACEVWDGRLAEGVMAEKLSAVDGGVMGRSAALGTIPFEYQHPARYYHQQQQRVGGGASGGFAGNYKIDMQMPDFSLNLLQQWADEDNREEPSPVRTIDC